MTADESSVSSTRFRVVVDRDVCSGHGRCYTLTPHLFDADDAGQPVVLVEVVGPDLVEDARRAELSCPERAITLEEI